MNHAELDRAHLHHLGAERGELQHLLVGDLGHAAGARHDARVGGVDAVDVGVDVAALGPDRRRDRHRRGVGAAAPERGDAAGLLVDALEAGDHRHLLALLEALEQLGAVDVEDARRGMGVGGADRQLPALPGARVDADALQHHRQQPRRHLLARGDDRVVFAGVMQRRGFPAPPDQLVSLARHRRYDHGDVVPGVHLTLDVIGDVADALDIGDGGSAELHHKAGHAGGSLHATPAL